ncbi:hypothetical protein ACROYT_G033819 [Oculina patagonica]
METQFNQTKMNHTTDNITFLSCGFAFLPINPAKICPIFHVVFNVRLAVNALTCPLIILLNILVMVAVKTKRQLRTRSNVALACLATTDLVEVRRNEKQIAANQVSIEAKEKLLKNKKALYTRTIVLFAIFLCYIPTNICFAVLAHFKGIIPANIGHISLYLVGLLPVLNSMFNPLVYVVRIRYFRVAFIQLLSRKTIAQAEELERKIFGPRRIGVRASREEVEQHGNETLNNGYETTVRTQPQEEYEETPL